MHDEITPVYFGAIYFIHMFRVWGLNMLMFASGIVGSSDVKLRQQLGISLASEGDRFPKQNSLCVDLAARG